MRDIIDFRNALYKTTVAAGLSMIPDDKCCQVLAYLYVYGGANEQMVFNDSVRNAIFYAQVKLKINSGRKQDRKLCTVLQEYIKSIINYENPPEWVLCLEKEYRIKPQRGGKK